MSHYLYNVYLQSFQRPPDPIITQFYQNTREDVISNDVAIYKRQVAKGRKEASQRKLVLTGLIRNGENNIPFLERFYNRLKPLFKETVFLIVENNSIDKTRERLLEWHRTDPSVNILCDYMKEANTEICVLNHFDKFYVDKIPYAERIMKLSYLRNLYLDTIKEKYNDADYLAVLDLDLSGQFFIDGILNSIYHFSERNDITAISCNGLVRHKRKNDKFEYYDSFAYVELHNAIEWDTTFDKSSHDHDVLNYITKKYMKNMNLDQVRSAFGGFCLYQLERVLESKARYSYSKNNKLSCEHSHFHSGMEGVYVNPRMIFLIDAV